MRVSLRNSNQHFKHKLQLQSVENFYQTCQWSQYCLLYFSTNFSQFQNFSFFTNCFMYFTLSFLYHGALMVMVVIMVFQLNFVTYSTDCIQHFGGWPPMCLARTGFALLQSIYRHSVHTPCAERHWYDKEDPTISQPVLQSSFYSFTDYLLNLLPNYSGLNTSDLIVCIKPCHQ